MQIRDNIHRSLPAIYFTCGALTFLGAAYIGIGDGLMPGYATLGLASMISGLLVTGRYRKLQSTVNSGQCDVGSG